MKHGALSREILLKDSVEYIQHPYSDEAELEQIVLEHTAEIFGSATLVFPKRKVKSKGGTGSVPDAYILDFHSKSWSLVEVELDRHPLHEHIVSQITNKRLGGSDLQLPPIFVR